MAEKWGVEDAVYNFGVDESRVEDVVAAIEKELPLEYGVFRRWAKGSCLSIGDVGTWVASSTHYPYATKGAVL